MISLVRISPIEPDWGIHFPTDEGKYLWIKPIPDGSIEYYQSSNTGWVKILTIPAPASANHSHPTHGNINFTGTIQADGDTGLSGTKTIAGYTFTFKKGLLVGFQAP